MRIDRLCVPAADGELYTFGRGGEFQLGHETVMALGNASQYRGNSAPTIHYQPKPTRLPALVRREFNVLS
jgi:hypothetical protein